MGEGIEDRSGAESTSASKSRALRPYVLWGLVAAAAAYPGHFTFIDIAKSLGYLIGAFVIALGIRWMYQRVRERETIFWSPWIMLLTALVVLVLMFPDRSPPSKDRDAPDHDQLLAAFDLPGYEIVEPPESETQPLEEELESAASNPDVREVESKGVIAQNGASGFVVIGTLDPDELNNETISQFASSLTTNETPPELLEIEGSRVYSIAVEAPFSAFAFLDYDGLMFLVFGPDDEFLRQLSAVLIQANDLGVPESV
jgi:hypothetical protein